DDVEVLEAERLLQTLRRPNVLLGRKKRLEPRDVRRDQRRSTRRARPGYVAFGSSSVLRWSRRQLVERPCGNPAPLSPTAHAFTTERVPKYRVGQTSATPRANPAEVGVRSK